MVMMVTVKLVSFRELDVFRRTGNFRRIGNFRPIALFQWLYLGNPESSCSKSSQKSDLDKRYSGHKLDKLDSITVKTDETIDDESSSTDQFTQGTLGFILKLFM